MAARQYDFELVSRLDPDAVGLPGHRRFRLVAQNETATAFLWLEKEQLQALGLAVDQLLTPIKAVWSRGAEAAAAAAPATFDGGASVEIRVGRLGLGFDEDAKRFVLVAHDLEAGADDPPTFRCQCSRSQLARLSEGISVLTTAGRSRCPLCGTPLSDGPHFCPGSNGHAHHD
jgi:uncharacterized repeat protein (TIGR03847 family)